MTIFFPAKFHLNEPDWMFFGLNKFNQFSQYAPSPLSTTSFGTFTSKLSVF